MVHCLAVLVVTCSCMSHHTPPLPRAAGLTSHFNIFIVFLIIYNNYLHMRSAIFLWFWLAFGLAFLPPYGVGTTKGSHDHKKIDAVQVNLLNFLKQNVVRKIPEETSWLGVPPPTLTWRWLGRKSSELQLLTGPSLQL